MVEKSEKGGIYGEMNQTNIEQKGIKGEQWVSKNLRELSCFVQNRGQHRFPFDLLVSKNGKEFGVQVKYKEPRIHYPDTGFEKWRWEMYKKWQNENEKKMLILFTDNSKKIYGNWLDNLGIEKGHGNCYNKENNCEMIYWWKKKLKDFTELI